MRIIASTVNQKINLFHFLIAAAMVFTLLLITCACGKKNSPRPPEDFAPGQVRYLTAEGVLDAVVLMWQAPESAAEPLLLTHFVVYRTSYKKDEEPDFEELGQVAAAEPPQDNTELKASQNQPAKIYSWRDPNVDAGKQYEYKVVGVNEDGVEGEAGAKLRVTFLGESSYFEALPLGE